MRITNGIIARNTQFYIQQGLQRMSKTQEIVSSTKRINHISDDPNVLSQLLNVRSKLEMNDQYMRNIKDGLGYLDSADAALSTTESLLIKALEYAEQGATGTMAEEDRIAIGHQIDKMIDELKDLANTTVGGKYIFAGTDNGEPPFKRDVDGAGNDIIIYEGNFERVYREILDQADYEINLLAVSPDSADPAAGLFGAISLGDNAADPPPYEVKGGVFDTLINLKNNLMNNDTEGLQQSIGEINKSTDHVLSKHVWVGARTRHFESVQDQLLGQEVRLNATESNLEDADVARTSIDLAQHQLAYNASLAVGSQMLQMSLLDFLR